MKTLSSFFIALLLTSFVGYAQKLIPVMLLTGEETPAHAWKTTTPAIEKILAQAGIFKVSVVILPQTAQEIDNLAIKFDDYKAIVFNYDVPSERWSESLKKQFEQYMSGGGGFVSIHATDNAFPDWAEFNKMIGVGGWRNRTETAGPYWYYQNNKLVSDTKPGRAGSHGSRTPFLMKVENANHPITKGLPTTWLHQGDELYAKLRGPGNNMNVLVTAYSDTSNRGTGHNEPQLITLSYGKGRIFHYTPGHDVMAMSSVDYVVLLQRGTEWAATGKVTQKVPADFPTATTIAYRADIAALDPVYKNGLNGLDRQNANQPNIQRPPVNIVQPPNATPGTNGGSTRPAQ